MGSTKWQKAWWASKTIEERRAYSKAHPPSKLTVIRCRIVKRYGEAGWEIFQAARECPVCLKGFTVVRPTIHHLDLDASNNKRGNLVVVCFSCHISYHQRLKRIAL